MQRARRSSPGRSGGRGFTLIEIVMVLMLIAMLTGVLITASSSIFAAAKEQDAETAVLSLLQKARVKAVESGEIVEITPLPEDAGFLWGDEGVEELPKREGYRVRLLQPEMTSAFLIAGQLEEKAVARVRFYPDGSCDPIRVQVLRGEIRRVYAIDPWTAAPLPDGGRKP